MPSEISNFDHASFDPGTWSFQVENRADSVPTIKIRGVIGVPTEARDFGVEAAGTLDQLEKELEALGDVDEIELRVYSPGGYVRPAMALHDLIADHPARFTGIVDGGAGSAATLPLMACDVIRCPRNTPMMIHNAQAPAYGDYREMEARATALRRESRVIADLYTDRILRSTGQTDRAAVLSKVVDLMNAGTNNEGTTMTGTEAVELGLADEVAAEIDVEQTISEHLAAMGPVNLAYVPTALRPFFDTPDRIEVTHTDPQPMPEDSAPAAPAPDAVENVAPESAPEVTVTPAPEAAPSAPEAPAVENVETVASAPEPAPAAPDITAQLTEVVTAALVPLQKTIDEQNERIENLQNLRSSGVPAQAWGSQPATAPASGDPDNVAPIDFENMTPLQLINMGRTAQQSAS